jgi:hypothetical protein
VPGDGTLENQEKKRLEAQRHLAPSDG